VCDVGRGGGEKGEGQSCVNAHALSLSFSLPLPSLPPLGRPEVSTEVRVHTIVFQVMI
jgi:hypothetical protein